MPHAPALIPTASGPVGTATRIIGWGQTCAPAGCGGAPVIAHEADTSIVKDNRCGGINGSWPLIGVTSRAGNSDSTCATAPSVYGDLPSIRNWIDQQVGGLPTGPPPATGNVATSASYTSPWKNVAAVNDGIDPTTSNDTINQRWGT